MITQTLLFLSISAAILTSGCNSPGCALCDDDLCQYCFKRYNDDGDCSEDLAPTSENCLMYSLTEPNCVFCKKGWGVNVNKDWICEPKEVDKCVQLFISPEDEPICNVCLNGVPNLENRAECIDYPSSNGQWDNCMWGTIVNGDRYACNRCIDGYTVKGISETESECVPSKIKGCMVYKGFFEDSCLLCNVFTGYQTDDQGGCVAFEGVSK